jgi:hypothetical protein
MPARSVLDEDRAVPCVWSGRRFGELRVMRSLELAAQGALMDVGLNKPSVWVSGCQPSFAGGSARSMRVVPWRSAAAVGPRGSRSVSTRSGRN